MTPLPEYEIYAIRYATQALRSEGHMFMGGDHAKMIRGLDFFTYALKGAGRVPVSWWWRGPSVSGRPAWPCGWPSSAAPTLPG